MKVKKKKEKRGKNRQAVNSERKKFPVGNDMRLKRTLNLLYVYYQEQYVVEHSSWIVDVEKPKTRTLKLGPRGHYRRNTVSQQRYKQILQIFLSNVALLTCKVTTK